MKIGVIADTHGNLEAATKALDKLAGLGAEVFVHLGDGIYDACRIEADMGIFIEKISGNNEESNDLPDEKIFEWNGRKVLAIHGHMQKLNAYLSQNRYIKRLETIAQKAKNVGAEIVLFGHTHMKLDIDVDGVRFLNPGALDLGAKEKSFLLIDLSYPQPKTAFLTLDP